MDASALLNFVILPNGNLVRCPTPAAARNVARNFFPSFRASEVRGARGTLTIMLFAC